MVGVMGILCIANRIKLTSLWGNTDPIIDNESGNGKVSDDSSWGGSRSSGSADYDDDTGL